MRRPNADAGGPSGWFVPPERNVHSVSFVTLGFGDIAFEAGGFHGCRGLLGSIQFSNPGFAY